MTVDYSARTARRATLLALVCAPVAPVAGAQPLPPLDEYHIRAFGVGSGLLAADVTALVQTRNGYLYVGSGRGLARFDGYTFRRVPLADFQSNSIAALFEDSRGRLWILSSLDGIGYVHAGRMHLVAAGLGAYTQISETSDGAVWLGGAGGLVQVSPGPVTRVTRFTRGHGLPVDTIGGVFDLADGERVVVTSRQLARVEVDSGAEGGIRFVPFGPRYLPSVDARADPNGLWVASTDRVFRYRDGRFTLHGRGIRALTLGDFGWGAATRDAFLPSNFGLHLHFAPEDLRAAGLSGRLVSFAVVTRDGSRWYPFVSPREGRDQLVRERNGRLETLPLDAYLDFKTIQQLLEDDEGNLWVGTDRGLLQLTPRNVFALTRSHGLSESFTVAVVQTRDGAVWVGTWGGGLHRFTNGRLDRRYTMKHGLPNNQVRGLYEASDGTLWVGMANGFAAIRNDRVVLSEFTAEEVRAFAETRGGPTRRQGNRLWIGTARRLLVQTSAGFTAHRPHHWRDKRIWALHTARDGALWIASEGGLFRLEGDSLGTYGEADGLRSPFTVSIHEEPDGTLWVGTYEYGLHRYRGGRLAAVTTREGLHHDGVWRILDDGRGGLWMSSDAGIFRVERSRLNRVADAVERGKRPETPLTPLVFTEDAGMPNRESNRGFPGGWRLRDGRLLFNNVEGVVVIDPIRAAVPRPPPVTVLQGVYADGRAASLPAGRSEVPPGTKQLVFEFAAPSFAAPEQNRYRYRLDGYDDGWVHGGNQRRASYTNLRPGRYTFRVQGASGHGPWREPGAAYAFVVAPFVWQTWWFHSLAVALAAGLLAAAYRYRVARLLEMERLRMRIASDLHDDVGSNLSSIALLSEMLQGQTRLDDLEQRQLQRIHTAAEETIGALRDVIWLVDPKHDDYADLVAKLRGTAGDLLNGTAYTFNATDPGDPRPIGMTLMRNVLLIYKETLHNIVKHARAPHVVIDVGEDSGQLVMRIRDDGVGFCEATVRAGNGLENMRRRAQRTGGTIEIVSAPNRGTEVTFTARMA